MSQPFAYLSFSYDISRGIVFHYWDLTSEAQKKLHDANLKENYLVYSVGSLYSRSVRDRNFLSPHGKSSNKESAA